MMPYLAALEDYARKHRIPIVLPEGRAFLAEQVRRFQPRRVLELGTAIGYSALVIAEAMPSPCVVTIERDASLVGIARENIAQSPYAGCIEVVEADAIDWLAHAQAQTEPHSASSLFDLVFIDAAKAQYRRFFDGASALLSPRGVILCDNMLFRGKDSADKRYKTIRSRLASFRSYLETHPQFDTEWSDVGDGFAVSIRKG